MHETAFTLPVKQPFRLDLTAWVLRRRSKNIIDSWDRQTYRRVLCLGQPVLIAVKQQPTGLAIEAKSTQKLSAPELTKLKDLIEKILGTGVNLNPFYKLVAHEPALRSLAEQFKGVKPTRYPTLFEALVNAIACQQVSLDVGIMLLNRLAQNFGAKFEVGPSRAYSFPAPDDLLGTSEDLLKQLGFSHQKARAIWSLAYSVTNGDIDLEQLETASNEEAIAYLQSIRGIGRWSAEYVLLRALGRLDVFPGDDVGGQNNVQRLFKLDLRPGYEELSSLTAKWHPYAGLIYFHLLLDKLHQKGAQ